MFELGLGLFSEPWLVGMWGLFLFEGSFSEPCGAPAERAATSRTTAPG
jgi:hypothetical protein